MTKYTPMMEQYLSIKAEVPDAFLLFRLGDFYELFFDDALLASRELEITLTGREAGAEERVPMCGVPYHAVETYIARLIEKGYKVAICEQVENPAEAKGVVRREIVRIVTPGTVMDGKLLGDKANNFIVSLMEQDGQWGFSACDLSTGELFVTSFPRDLEALLEELNSFQPSEIIAEDAVLQQVQPTIQASYKRILLTRWEATEEDSQQGLNHFTEEEHTALQQQERAAVLFLLAYLYNTQKRSLAHIRQIRRYAKQQYMIVDPYTRRNLELTETVRDRSKKGSLFWLLDQTVTAMGGRMLRRWVDKPLIDRQAIEARQEAVESLFGKLIAREEIRGQLRDVYDMERLVGRIVYGTANGRDLAALMGSLRRVPELIELCRSTASRTFTQLTDSVDSCGDIADWIQSTLVDEPPISVREGGLIRQGCHERLDQLREASVNGKRWIAELEKQEREATGIKSLKIGFNKVFGYYIEVTRSNLGALPEGKYERKQTLANAERFITPELKEKEALILEAEETMVDIEYELFVQLRDRIASQTVRLQRLAEMIAIMDVYQSLAHVSADRRYVKPALTDGYEMSIIEGRHPVVESVMAGEPFIANDTGFSHDECRMLLITGPNMAGKSTYMRQVAYMSIMAQMGCFVPAEHAVMPIIDRIFTRIGAADDVIGGQSTFMVEMKDIQLMTAKATARSLVIIDELGRGTSTGEGMAIAQAVIEYVHNEIGCKTLVSTHYHELAHLETSLVHLRNYSMAVMESGEDVTFLRKLIRGAASTSYGIYCARIAGIPHDIIDRAYQILSVLEEQGSEQQVAVTGAGQPTQLSLFAEEAAQQSAKPDRMNEKANKVYRRIQEADFMNMTPMQAMQFIYELKNIQ